MRRATIPAVSDIEVRALNHAERDWASAFLRERWGSTLMVDPYRAHDAGQLPGLVASLDGEPCGLLTYWHDGDELEIVTLDSVTEDRGVGTALIEAACQAARKLGANRVWVITTNDNLRALGFYQRRGFALAALHRDGLGRVRRLKPEVPQVGNEGIPLRDMLELELVLR
jgi:ribosomal protein S18 acetylase RimI-like enzyme